ncbi:MAG: hypothetical protein DRN91_00235 [Candidatus Alkanophagales archaeon]|nr:MAG: hypothetical protein DRN91_00235 [Candidatus Alkanophagales archaeon]
MAITPRRHKAPVRVLVPHYAMPGKMPVLGDPVDP